MYAPEHSMLPSHSRSRVKRVSLAPLIAVASMNLWTGELLSYVPALNPFAPGRA